MRIGIVTTWFERGAAYVSRQYRDILEKSHDVFIFARGGELYAKDSPDWDNPKVTWATRLPPSSTPTKFLLVEFEQWLIKKQLDVVLFNEQWWWPPIVLCRRLGIRTVAYIDYYTEETVPLFAIYDLLLCNTKRHLSAFDWHPGATYLPWGTDLQLFQPLKAVSRTPSVTFFHSAGISPHRKGCDLVIQAFISLKGKPKLVIHSQKSLAAAFPHLSHDIDALKEEGRLELYERTVPAPGLFFLGDVYVYPTRLEGIGLTIMEAASCGLPVVVTDCGPMNEFIKHGSNGRLVEVERYIARSDGYYWPQAIVSISSLTEQMQWYVDNAALLPQLKTQARNHAENHFDWSKNTDQLCDLFNLNRRTPDLNHDIQVIKLINNYSVLQEHRHQISMVENIKWQLENRYPTLFLIVSKTWSFLKRYKQFRFRETKI